MAIQNRDQFLTKLAEKMGRPLRTIPTPMPTPLNDYPTTRLTDRNQAQLSNEFIDFAKVMMVDCLVVSEDEAAMAIIELCEKYGGGSVILNQDQRLVDLGIPPAVAQRYDYTIWSPDQGNINIEAAEKANIGIVYAEYGLAESGGIVLYSGADNGRSVSLLPEKSIVVVRKSTILPRVAQLAKILHKKAEAGERMPSCINIISGPSSTADIELIKVVGVHGPIAKIYLIIDDL